MWLELAKGLYDIYSGMNSKESDGMSYDDAYKMVAKTVNPKYEAARKGVLNNYTNNLQSRGLYGQAVGDSILSNAAAGVESNRIGDIASQAMGLYTNSQNQTNQNNQAAKQQKYQGISSGLSTLEDIDWDYVFGNHKGGGSSNGTLTKG